MLYVYRRASSVGAKALSVALGGMRFRGRLRPIEQQVKPGDVVISWGEAVPALPGVKVLNGTKLQNKYADAQMLIAAGVPTVNVSSKKPAPVPVGADAAHATWEEAVEAAEDFIEIPFTRQNPVFLQGVQDFALIVTKLKNDLAAPPAVLEEWLPRTFNHVGGADLLHPPAAPDYWAKKEHIIDEIRIHSFKGKSIRAGRKTIRADIAQHHPWIRSYDGGWSILYDGFESTKTQRDLAHRAVAALQLDFAAVDMGKKADGTWIVLEANRAPGLEGGSITTYATAIKTWCEA